MIEIDLTLHNLFYAGLVGVSRNVKGIKKEGQYGVDNKKVGWQVNCDGAAGEMAVAKWMGAFWDGAIGDFRAKDAGNLQVRTNPNDWGDLTLHKKDCDNDIFILVLSHETPKFYLRGWLYGREGKLERWWRDAKKNRPKGEKPRPAFFVPQNQLHDMGTLETGGVGL